MKTLSLILAAIFAAVAGIAYTLLGFLIFSMAARGHGYTVGAVVSGLWVPVAIAFAATYGAGFFWARWGHAKRRAERYSAEFARLREEWWKNKNSQGWVDQSTLPAPSPMKPAKASDFGFFTAPPPPPHRHDE